VDLNPLALWIASVRCQRRGAEGRAEFLAGVDRVAERSLERVRARIDARAPVPRSELRWYDVHVLKELAGLREEILAVEDALDRRAMGVLFSSLLVKFSRQEAETAERETPKRIRKGLVSDFFRRKGAELCERWASLDAALPPGARPARLIEGDARNLPQLLGPRYRAGTVVTSPPYGGTYDYVEHHARRYPWLGLSDARLRDHEIGARRHMRGREGALRWDRELLSVLKGLFRVTRREGRIVLLLGDAQSGRTRLPADEQIRRLSARAGLAVVAEASQVKPDFAGGKARREHLFLLMPAGVPFGPRRRT
jgi:hypothetical protein